MKQLIRLKDIKLYYIDSIQTPDGDFVKTSSFIKSYKAEVQELRDALSATIYGSDINKTVRFSSIRNELENYLYGKLNNTSDNISKYQIEFNNNTYEIVDLTRKHIDGKRL